MKKNNCDVLVIGSGGAGLRSAISAKETDKDIRVILVTKGRLGKCGVTALACSDRMAFHVTLPYTEPGGEESWKYHAEDIYKMGGGVSDEDLAEILARNSKDAFEYLERLGIPFVRKNGKVDQFVTDGSKYARAAYTGPDTANQIEDALIKKVREMDIDVIENHMLIDLIVSGNRVIGAVGIDTNPKCVSLEELGPVLTVYEVKSVILATGGAGEAYKVNVYPQGMTGDGYAIAYRAGAELVNMEFIQIGLSSVKTKLACSGTMLRAVPRVINSDGKEFLEDYLPKGTTSEEICNLLFAKGASWPVSYEAKSHFIDIAVFKEMNSGRKVYLDYNKNPSGLRKKETPLERLKRMNPEIIQWFKIRGIDLKGGETIEIAPAIQHFQGGVKIRKRGQTTVKGLYAVGECAGGQHGANRPGGNSLLDGQVFGRVAGYNAAREANETKNHEINENQIKSTLSYLNSLMSENGLKAKDAKEKIQGLLYTYASVIRTEEGLNKGLNELEKIKNGGLAVDKNGLTYCMEIINILDVALMVMTSARIRSESRGPHLFFHSYDDIIPIPRDDEVWKKYIVIKKVNNKMKCKICQPMNVPVLSSIRAKMEKEI